MGTGSSIFADRAGGESARSSDDGQPSIFRERSDDESGRDGDDGDASGVASDELASGEGVDGGDAAMTVFVDGERREFVLEES